ncbi:bifunctional hydroxymethylpyrimidine kinase/phosphomethylpyrimidine kinase [Rhodopirellula sp. P2]|uniref:bifunctional hydroxymethylpyrimidine kinase/phosphomethylpyrimidine kinase n=1 Tax=Rhodopirellula sp. P2 TaxID=2127060 RepID=UPI00236871E8|nr:bifunctional hydroxymethylpyrimidine kinase/phosphomethylpyrimidine kinase [Rhodopirellula sp. P2]WDQ18557.1 bifunctional hydroxymethylpyrimidine kinase/phosphomethylpyrimidine kinase [Rhodopirellula sp. P2]
MPAAAPVALTIAGSDPSGGAGLQADLKTFHTLGVYGCSVVTLLTAQNTLGVQGIQMVPTDFVRTQWASVSSDLPLAAIKTGALGNAEMIETVADCLASASSPVVIDPVMISKHGHPIIDEDAVAKLIERLFPLADLVTPNSFEAERLVGHPIRTEEDLVRVSSELLALGPNAVLLKTHLGDESVDCLADASGIELLRSPRLQSNRTHGSGCVLSAAITASLAQGEDFHNAVQTARSFVHAAIRNAPKLGAGISPLGLLAPIN